MEQATTEKAKQAPKDILSSPFQNIALAFSGGGFRAGAYALGVLSYFNELRLGDGKTLLDKVTYMSSASGGTITTATYALYNAQGKDFSAFYKHLYENLEGDNLLKKVFAILNDNKVWVANEPKTRNIINAFSIAYNELLFDHKLVADLKGSSTTHLDEVCFNTTEFYTGLLFRQAVKMRADQSADKEFLFGNFVVSLNHETAAGLRLGDLLAASSCFPAGFEPIIFPVDFGSPEQLLPGFEVKCRELSMQEISFLYDEQTIKETLAAFPNGSITEINQALAAKPLKPGLKIGLMDGGITDNQGVESIIKANDRRSKKQTDFKRFDLMLINDVGSHFMDPYELPKTGSMKAAHPKLTLKRIYAIASLLLVAGITGIVSSFFMRHPTGAKIVLIFSVLSTIAGLLPVALLSWIKSKIIGKVEEDKGFNLGKNFSSEVVTQMFSYFSNTPVEVIITMLKQRFNSVMTLNSDVFLKRVRQLLYKQFFDDEKNTLRVKANHIYDFSYTNDVNAVQNDFMRPKPSREIQTVAENAYNMATTLWFDSNNIRENTQASIIATGQFTTCFNLLQYVERLKAHSIYKNNLLAQEYLDLINLLSTKLTADAARFNADPFWLYNESGQKFGIEKFVACNSGMFEFPGVSFGGLR